jgi:hypothetical protein
MKIKIARIIIGARQMQIVMNKASATIGANGIFGSVPHEKYNAPPAAIINGTHKNKLSRWFSNSFCMYPV